MKKGDKVICIDAKEHGIPIKEGKVYTIKRYFPKPHAIEDLTGEALIKERENIPGVSLEETEGYFMVTRFKKVD